MRVTEMSFDMFHKAAQQMEYEGGSFAKSIAKAFYVADKDNQQRLITAFDDLFVEFYRKHCKYVLMQD